MWSRLDGASEGVKRQWLYRSMLFIVLLSLCIFTSLNPIHLFAEHHFHFGMVAAWIAFTLLGPPLAIVMVVINALVSAWFYVVAPDFDHMHWIATGPIHIAVMSVIEVVSVALLQRFAFRNASLLILVASYWGFVGMPAHILVHGFSPASEFLIPKEVNSFEMNLALGEFIAGLFNVFLASVLMGVLSLLLERRGKRLQQKPILLSDYFFNVIAVAVVGPAILLVIFAVLPAQRALESDIQSKLASDTSFFRTQVIRWFESRFLELERVGLQTMSSLSPSIFGPSLPDPELPQGIRAFWLLGEDSQLLKFLRQPEDSRDLNFSDIDLEQILSHFRGKSLEIQSKDFEFAIWDGRLFLQGPLAGGSIRNGALVAELNLEDLNGMLITLQKRSDSLIAVKDRQGNLLAKSDERILDYSGRGLPLGRAGDSFQHIRPAVLGEEWVSSSHNMHFQMYLENYAMRFSKVSQTVNLGPGVPFDLTTNVDVGKRLEVLEKAFVFNVQILLALVFFILCAIKFGTRRIVAPLTELMNRTSDLTKMSPDRLPAAMLISPFREIQMLQMNFIELAKSLYARFEENRKARAELEMRVFERTRMLQRSNDSLASEIAERKLLAEDRDRIIGILQTAADFIGMATPEGKMIWLNDFARRSQGLSPDDDISELTIADFHPPWAVDRIVHEAIPAAIRHGFWVGEGALLDQNGIIIPVSQMVIAHKDPSGHTRYLSTIQRDMRGFKKVQHELEQAKLEAEEANRSKTLFLANMSHEVRTPVAVIRGFAELLTTGHATAMEKKDWLMSIVSSSRQLELLINDILDISKVESGKLQFEVTSLSLVNFIYELKTIMEVNAKAKGLTLEFVCESFVPEFIRTDANRLRQILLNLIGNAIKFTEKGSICVRVGMFPIILSDKRRVPDRSHSDGFEKSPRLRFLISDTGPGISGENQGRLFQPFVQADSTISRKFGGTGLGLYLSRQLAHLLGGSLRLESSVPGEGTTFALEIDPGDVMDVSLVNSFEKVKLRDANGDRVANKKGRLVADLSRLRILVIEDAPELRLLLGQVLRTAGASIEFAQDGKEGIERAESTSFDLVLMDLQMPVMNGYLAMEELKRRGYSTPVIALTAHALVGERERCLEVGFTEYLTKPVNFRLLTETIARLCNEALASRPVLEDELVTQMPEKATQKRARPNGKKEQGVVTRKPESRSPKVRAGAAIDSSSSPIDPKPGKSDPKRQGKDPKPQKAGRSPKLKNPLDTQEL